MKLYKTIEEEEEYDSKAMDNSDDGTQQDKRLYAEYTAPEAGGAVSFEPYFLISS